MVRKNILKSRLFIVFFITNICGNYSNLPCIIKPLVSMVNLTCFHGLNHFHLHEFFSEIEAEYPDLLYHTSVQ